MDADRRSSASSSSNIGRSSLGRDSQLPDPRWSGSHRVPPAIGSPRSPAAASGDIGQDINAAAQAPSPRPGAQVRGADRGRHRRFAAVSCWPAASARLGPNDLHLPRLLTCLGTSRSGPYEPNSSKQKLVIRSATVLQEGRGAWDTHVVITQPAAAPTRLRRRHRPPTWAHAQRRIWSPLGFIRHDPRHQTAGQNQRRKTRFTLLPTLRQVRDH